MLNCPQGPNLFLHQGLSGTAFNTLRFLSFYLRKNQLKIFESKIAC
jgi:hypothetical protein